MCSRPVCAPGKTHAGSEQEAGVKEMKASKDAAQNSVMTDKEMKNILTAVGQDGADEEDSMMTVKELSDYMHLSKTTIYNLIHTSSLPTYFVGRAMRFKKEEIKKWIDNLYVRQTREDSLRFQVPEKSVYDEEFANTETLLVESPIFSGFSKHKIREFIKQSEYEIRRYSKDALIVAESEVLDGIGMVDSGELRYNIDNDSENEISLNILRRGTFFGLDVMFTRSRGSYLNIYARTDASVKYFPFRKMEEFMKHDVNDLMLFMANVMRIISDDNIRHAKHIRILMGKAARSRIISYLEFEEKKKGGSPFALMESRGEIAAHLDIAREVLNSELKKMQDEGLISISKTMVTIIRDEATGEKKWNLK